jgi:hypothetical protein
MMDFKTNKEGKYKINKIVLIYNILKQAVIPFGLISYESGNIEKNIR